MNYPTSALNVDRNVVVALKAARTVFIATYCPGKMKTETFIMTAIIQMLAFVECAVFGRMVTHDHDEEMDA